MRTTTRYIRWRPFSRQGPANGASNRNQAGTGVQRPDSFVPRGADNPQVNQGPAIPPPVLRASKPSDARLPRRPGDLPANERNPQIQTPAEAMTQIHCLFLIHKALRVPG